MGLEYRIQTYDHIRAKLPEFLPTLPAFAGLVDGTYQFGQSAARPMVSIRIESDHVYLCEHAASAECDAIFAGLMRRLITVNDHVVISEW